LLPAPSCQRAARLDIASSQEGHTVVLRLSLVHHGVDAIAESSIGLRTRWQDVVASSQAAAGVE
jgi:hypothetical protein